MICRRGLKESLWTLLLNEERIESIEREGKFYVNLTHENLKDLPHDLYIYSVKCQFPNIHYQANIWTQIKYTWKPLGHQLLMSNTTIWIQFHKSGNYVLCIWDLRAYLSSFSLFSDTMTLPSSSGKSAVINQSCTGSPQPLGPSPLSSSSESGVNFALFSQHASRVTLELFDQDGNHIRSISLDPHNNKTGDIWHVAVESLPLSGVQYGWRVGGEGGWETGHRWSEEKILLDPYAPLVTGRRVFAHRDAVEHFIEKVSFIR